MKQTSVLLGAIILAGCVSQTATTKTATVFGYLEERKANEVVLIEDIQYLNKNLLFLSAGEYSCGEPNDEELQSILAITDAKQNVKQRYDGDKAFTEAWNVLEKYRTSIEKFNTKEGDEAVKSLDTASDLLGKIVDVAGKSLPLASSELLKTGVKEFTEFVRRRQAWRAVQAAQKTLDETVKVLKFEYSRLSGRELKLFRYWDSCAVETLKFVRDAPRNKISGFNDKAYFSQLSAAELLDLREKYLAKRERYSPGTADEWSNALNAVLTENERLAKGQGVYDPKGVSDAIDKVKTFREQLRKLSD